MKTYNDRTEKSKTGKKMVQREHCSAHVEYQLDGNTFLEMHGSMFYPFLACNVVLFDRISAIHVSVLLSGNPVCSDNFPTVLLAPFSHLMTP